MPAPVQIPFVAEGLCRSMRSFFGHMRLSSRLLKKARSGQKYTRKFLILRRASKSKWLFSSLLGRKCH
jgi:hypothetical protein